MGSAGADDTRAEIGNLGNLESEARKQCDGSAFPQGCAAAFVHCRDELRRQSVFPPELEELRRHQQKTLDPARYAWIWEGAYYELSDAQVFKGKYEVAEFEPSENWDGPYFGLDFGFAQDPTAAVQCWIHGDRLYIEREAGSTGIELDDTAAVLQAAMPDIASHVVRADSARPESISYLKRHGLPRIAGALKGKGSVEDGIGFIRSFDKVVIHPRCVNTAREFRLYSYKTDRLSGDILPAAAGRA